MTRIIGGIAGGRQLAVPGRGTRPTSDRVREALFSALDSRLLAQGRGWSDISVLDLYAGSGALGLEALSRGARSVVLVERSPSAARVAQANADRVGLSGAQVLVRDTSALAADAPAVQADLVLADPPYGVQAQIVADALDALHRAGWIAEGATVVVERSGRDMQVPLPATWPEATRRTYGDTVLWYGRAQRDPAPDASGGR